MVDLCSSIYCYERLILYAKGVTNVDDMNMRFICPVGIMNIYASNLFLHPMSIYPNLFSISAYICGEISSLLFPCTSTTIPGLLSL